MGWGGRGKTRSEGQWVRGGRAGGRGRGRARGGGGGARVIRRVDLPAPRAAGQTQPLADACAEAEAAAAGEAPSSVSVAAAGTRVYALRRWPLHGSGRGCNPFELHMGRLSYGACCDDWSHRVSDRRRNCRRLRHRHRRGRRLRHRHRKGRRLRHRHRKGRRLCHRHRGDRRLRHRHGWGPRRLSHRHRHRGRVRIHFRFGQQVSRRLRREHVCSLCRRGRGPHFMAHWVRSIHIEKVLSLVHTTIACVPAAPERVTGAGQVQV